MSLLYSNANISRNELSSLPVPGARGAYHKPYGFGQYMDDVEEALNINGLQILDQEYEVTNGNNRFFGAVEVAPLSGEWISKNDPDYSLLVGVRGSHDQKIPRGLVLGTRVMVCSNLCFSGNIGEIRTKQTLNMTDRLPGLLSVALSRVPEMAEAQDRKFEIYKDAHLGKGIGDAMLVEIFRKGGLSAAQLGVAAREWVKPSHDEHAEYGFSAWRLFNACTEALKPRGERVNHQTIANRSGIIDTFIARDLGVH